MPMQQAKSGLMAKYGTKLDQAVKAHANEPIVERGFRNVPPGITDGRLQIIECFFEKQEADTKALNMQGKPAVGDYIFKAVGIVQDDFANADNEPTKGIQMRIGNGYGIACYDTKRGENVYSQEEAIAEILNFFKMWGIDTTDAGAAQLESFAAAIQETQPYIKFTTTKAKKASQDGSFRTWENWGKADPDYVPPEASSEIVDKTKPSSNSTAKPPASKAAPEPPFGDNLDDLVAECNSQDENTAADATAKMKKLGQAVGVDVEDEQYADWEAAAEAIRQAQGGSSEEDLDALAVAADEAGDDAAIEKLTAIAAELDLDPNDFGPWADLVTAIKEKQGGDADAVQWAEGETCSYKINKADKKTTDCEILKITDDKCTLKNLTTGKTIINAQKKPLLVPLADLIAP